MSAVGVNYTVGVKRRFWFGFVDYEVVSHAYEHATGQLELHLVDGSHLNVPGLLRRPWKVYPNYSTAQEKIHRLRESVRQEQIKAEPVIDFKAEDDFDKILAEQAAAR